MVYWVELTQALAFENSSKVEGHRYLNRCKIHLLGNVFCNRKDNQFLSSPRVAVVAISYSNSSTESNNDTK